MYHATYTCGVFDGTGLAKIRREAGLSQQQLAVKAGLTVTTVAMLEQGIRPNPSVQTVLAIAEALGVPMERLVRAQEQTA